MGSIIPIAGVVQWVSGIAVGLIALQRGWRYGQDGRGPRVLARAALAILMLAALEVIVALTDLRTIVAPWVSPDFASERWQLRLLLAMSVVAWLCLALAGSWNGVLGVRLRRRVAASELKRRTERALAGLPGHRSPPSSGRPTP